MPVFCGKNECVHNVRNHFKILILYVPSNFRLSVIYATNLSKKIIIMNLS